MFKSSSLFFQEGTSDKEYNIYLVKSGNGYQVTFTYGKRGGNLKEGTKTDTPVSLEEAEKIYNSLLKSKLAKGYQEVKSGNSSGPNVNFTYNNPNLLSDEDLIKMVDGFDNGEKIKVVTTKEIRELKLGTCCGGTPNEALAEKKVLKFLDDYCGGKIALQLVDEDDGIKAGAGALQFVNTNFAKKFPKDFIEDYELHSVQFIKENK